MFEIYNWLDFVEGSYNFHDDAKHMCTKIQPKLIQK